MNTAFKWTGMIDNNPLARMAVYPAAGYVAGKYGSRLLSGALINLLKSKGINADPDAVNELVSGNIPGVLGAGLGALFAARPYWGAKSFSQFGKSIVNPHSVWKDVKPVKEYYQSAISGGKSYKQNLAAMNKTSSANFDIDQDEMHPWEQHTFNTLSIPVSNSMHMVNNDKFMDPFAKKFTNTSIYGAEGKSVGMISGKQLMQGAIKAGAAYVPAYFFGKTVGSLLALPEDISNKIGLTGGLASAVYNSGIIKQDF